MHHYIPSHHKTPQRSPVGQQPTFPLRGTRNNIEQEEKERTKEGNMQEQEKDNQKKRKK
jgi:hypothetical protein